MTKALFFCYFSLGRLKKRKVAPTAKSYLTIDYLDRYFQIAKMLRKYFFKYLPLGTPLSSPNVR